MPAGCAPDYRDKPVLTDGLETYQGFFSAKQHRACQKGSGETRIVESLNTKWRQRQSGLARRSWGVSRRIQDDLIERFFLLIEQPNEGCSRQQKRPWQTTQPSQ